MAKPSLVDLEDQVGPMDLVDLDHLVDLGFLVHPWVRVVHRYQVDLLVHQVDPQVRADLVDQVDQVDLWHQWVQGHQEVPLDRPCLEGQVELEVQVEHNKRVCRLEHM